MATLQEKCRKIFAYMEHLGKSHTKQHNTSGSTPWKINMEPENDGLEDDFPFQLGDF